MSTRKMKKAAKLFDRSKVYSREEAVNLIKGMATKTFDESVEVHFRLGINPKKGEQQVRGTAVLPHSFGKSKIVAAFVSDEKAKAAKEAGADVVYVPSDIPGLIKSAKIEFEVAVAMPDIMKNLAPLAKVLGPKGLMPSPKNETITTNLKKTIDELKKGKIAFKNDDTGNLHQVFGKASLDAAKLIENLNVIIEAITKAKPETSKGAFLRGITICSTMGPGIKIN